MIFTQESLPFENMIFCYQELQYSKSGFAAVLGVRLANEVANQVVFRKLWDDVLSQGLGYLTK